MSMFTQHNCVPETPSQKDHHHHQEQEKDQQAEEEQYIKVLKSFVHYRSNALAINDKKRKDFLSIDPEQQKLIAHFHLAKLDAIDRRINKNFEFIMQMLHDNQVYFQSPLFKSREHPVSEQDIDKVKSTLRQFVRDWSEEGKLEREKTYTPLVDCLENIFKNLSMEEKGKIKVLVPGAGLGRLTYEIVKRGYSCQGNEISFHMLIASNYILNRVSKPFQHEIFPWIHSLSNAIVAGDVLEGFKIPDATCFDIPRTAEYSMSAGDFTEIYSQQNELGSWDVVVTCFFIDTARNILDYFKVISGLLKEGGHWLNLGPLLYHYEGMPTEISIELTMEEIRNLLPVYKFELMVK